jgi:hypothetical protein
MDADDGYLRKSRLIWRHVYVYVCTCFWLIVSIKKRQNSRTNINLHKHIADDEDYEILTHPPIYTHSILLYSPGPNIYYVVKGVANKDKRKSCYCYH